MDISLTHNDSGNLDSHITEIIFRFQYLKCKYLNCIVVYFLMFFNVILTRVLFNWANDR